MKSTYLKFTIGDIYGPRDRFWKRVFLRELNSLRGVKASKKQKLEEVNSIINGLQKLSPIEFISYYNGETFGLEPLILYKNLRKAIFNYTLNDDSHYEKFEREVTRSTWVYSPLEREALEADVLAISGKLFSIVFNEILTKDYRVGLSDKFIEEINKDIVSMNFSTSETQIQGNNLYVNRAHKAVLLTLFDLAGIPLPYRLLNVYRGGSYPVTIMANFSAKNLDFIPGMRHSDKLKLKFPETYLSNHS